MPFSLIIAIIIFAFIFGEYISKPIIKLTDGAKKIESGNYKYKVDIKQNDEIGKLAVTFNNMAAMINLKITELEQANEDLTRCSAQRGSSLGGGSLVTSLLLTAGAGVRVALWQDAAEAPVYLALGVQVPGLRG